MQNFIKSQTRLAFIQYIFQSEFLESDSEDNMEDFQKHFYNSDIAIIDQKKELQKQNKEMKLLGLQEKFTLKKEQVALDTQVEKPLFL